VRIIRRIVSALYGLVFGPLDRVVRARSESRLKEWVRGDFSFLLLEKEGKFVNNDPPDYSGPGAIVTLETRKLVFRAVSDRGSTRMDIASLPMPRTWFDLELVIKTLLNLPPRPLAAMLREHWTAIEEAFSPDNLDSVTNALKEAQVRELTEFLEVARRSSGVVQRDGSD
jgi:hypothetical protein